MAIHSSKGWLCARMASSEGGGREEAKEVTMKFLLAVLAIHFIGEWISLKTKDKRSDNAAVMNEPVRHPAEFELR